MSAVKEIPCLPIGVRGQERYVAIVPGADVPLLALDLPSGLRGSAREDVARRQLRDRIGTAGDGVEMRPFFAPGGGAMFRRALIADAARLVEWRAKAGQGCQAVLPDYLVLSASEGLWNIRVAKDLVFARLGLEDGFSAEAGLARLMLKRALVDETVPRPKAVLLRGDEAGLAPLFADLGIAVESDPAALGAHGVAQPLALGHGELSFDLRADPRAARDAFRRKVLPWRWPVLFGLLAAGVWAAAQMLTIRTLERETQSETAATLTLVRQSFVPDGPILDLQVQVSRVLAERQDAARDWLGRVSPVSLFGKVARVVAGSGVASAEYSYEDATLTAILQAPDFATAERLVKGIEATGLTVEVIDQRVSDSAAGVRTYLLIRASQ